MGHGKGSSTSWDLRSAAPASPKPLPSARYSCAAGNSSRAATSSQGSSKNTPRSEPVLNHDRMWRECEGDVTEMSTETCAWKPSFGRPTKWSIQVCLIVSGIFSEGIFSEWSQGILAWSGKGGALEISWAKWGLGATKPPSTRQRPMILHLGMTRLSPGHALPRFWPGFWSSHQRFATLNQRQFQIQHCGHSRLGFAARVANR